MRRNQSIDSNQKCWKTLQNLHTKIGKDQEENQLIQSKGGSQNFCNFGKMLQLQHVEDESIPDEEEISETNVTTRSQNLLKEDNFILPNVRIINPPLSNLVIYLNRESCLNRESIQSIYSH